MLSNKTFESFYDDYEPDALKCQLHLDEVISLDKGPIKSMRLAVFELDGAFLAIRTDIWGDFSRQEIDIFQTLDEALECIVKAEEETQNE